MWEAKQQWIAILSQFQNLTALTLNVEGDPAWPGRTDVEDTLITLRMAVEEVKPPKLATLCLFPIHATGIIHLRWLGMGAFGDAHPLGSQVWRNIKTLDMRILNPFAMNQLTDAQSTMFKKILYEYLRSFAPTLEVLRFVWLGGEAPSPLTLHLLSDLDGRAEIQWPKLRELWVGSIINPRQMISLVPHLAKNVTQLKMLRSSCRDSSIEYDSNPWMDLTHMLHVNDDDVEDAASSVYSGSPPQSPKNLSWEGSVSRTSGELEIYLAL